MTSREELFSEYSSLLNDNDNNNLTRDIYRKVSKYKNEYMQHFGSYTEFLDQYKKSIESFDSFNSKMSKEDYDKLVQKNSIQNEESRDVFDIDFEQLDLLAARKYLYKQNSKISQLKRENKLLLQQQIAEDDIIDKFINKFKVNVNDKLNLNLKIKEKTDKSLMLHLSDAHLGEVVDNNGEVIYNTEIGLGRIDTLFEKFLNMVEEAKPYQTHILINGDMISGSIHDELERTNDVPDTECVMNLANNLIENIIKTLKVVGKNGLVSVDVLVGNHARTKVGKPYVKNKVKDNWEYLLGRIIQSYFDKQEIDNLEVCVPDTWYKLRTINGVTFLETHGDCLANGGGGFAGLPIASLVQKTAKMYGMLESLADMGYEVEEDTKFQYVVVGHFHKTATVPLFNGGKLFVNGTLKGTDEYSISRMTGTADCEQTVFEISDFEIINIKYIRVGE